MTPAHDPKEADALLERAGHRLRQPLLALSLNVAVLQRQVSDPAARQTVQRLAQSAEQVGALVDELLALARERPRPPSAG